MSILHRPRLPHFLVVLTLVGLLAGWSTVFAPGAAAGPANYILITFPTVTVVAKYENGVIVNGQGFTPGGLVYVEAYDYTWGLNRSPNTYFVASTATSKCYGYNCYFVPGGQFSHAVTYTNADGTTFYDACYSPRGAAVFGLRAYDYGSGQWSNTVYYQYCS